MRTQAEEAYHNWYMTLDPIVTDHWHESSATLELGFKGGYQTCAEGPLAEARVLLQEADDAFHSEVSIDDPTIQAIRRFLRAGER